MNSRKGNKNPMYGKCHTSETKIKIGVKSKGNQYALGYKFTPEQRVHCSAGKIGNENALGFHHTEKWKAEHHVRMMGNKNALGFHHTLESIKKILIVRQTMRTKTSNIEKIVANLLGKLGEEYIREYRVGSWLADFYLPKRQMIIECDGGYWHTLPGVEISDRLKDLVYDSVGLKILRLKEKDIQERLNICEELIMKKITEPFVQLYRIGALFDRYIIDLIREERSEKISGRARKVEFALTNYLKVRECDTKQLLSMVKDLAFVNEKLWDAENKIRKSGLSIIESGEIGREIGKLNDKRTAIQNQIDSFFGLAIEEKIYK